MIQKEDLVLVGKLLKTHGVKGELILQVDNSNFDIIEKSYIVCCVDGIFVPFFIEQILPKATTTYLIKLYDINSDVLAKKMAGMCVYLSKEALKNLDFENSTIFTWKDFIGYTVESEKYGTLGKITFVDESTSNIFFGVSQVDNDFLIPANVELISNVNDEQKIITILIPDGLLDI